MVAWGAGVGAGVLGADDDDEDDDDDDEEDDEKLLELDELEDEELDEDELDEDELEEDGDHTITRYTACSDKIKSFMDRQTHRLSGKQAAMQEIKRQRCTCECKFL